MAKRKLSRHQLWRIKKIQEERQERAQRKVEQVLEKIKPGSLGREQEGLVITHFGATSDVEAVDGVRYRCVSRQNIDSPVSGDRVVWQTGPDSTGVITALMPRTSVLSRTDPMGRERAVAANISQILIVVAPRPVFSEWLLDQYLVAAESIQITPIILINKVDLLSPAEQEALHERLAVYREIGYSILLASVRLAGGTDRLERELNQRTSVFVGQSGVGKSSLIQKLLPGETLRTAELSAVTGQGRHTTSAVRLYHLSHGGDLIDSPGVRDFGLGDVGRDQLLDGFIEFRPYLGKCRFRDCRHRHEPGCAIQAAIKTGQIGPTRLANYLRLAEMLEAGAG